MFFRLRPISERFMDHMGSLTKHMSPLYFEKISQKGPPKPDAPLSQKYESSKSIEEGRELLTFVRIYNRIYTFASIS